MTNLRKAIFVCAALSFLIGLPNRSEAASITIGTGTGFDPPSDGFTAGTRGQGQTFVVPLGFPVLDEFDFRWGGSVGSADYYFEIYEWEPGQPTQPPIFSEYHEDVANIDHVWFTGSLELIPGATYLALVRAASQEELFIEHRDNEDMYPNGAFIVLTDTGQFVPGGPFMPTQFHNGSRTDDTFFEARFTTPVPEPASLLLVGSGLASVITMRRARRHQRKR